MNNAKGYFITTAVQNGRVVKVHSGEIELPNINDVWNIDRWVYTSFAMNPSSDSDKQSNPDRLQLTYQPDI